MAAWLGLAACEDQPQVEPAKSYSNDVRSVFTAARGAGAILLDVQGAESLGDADAVRAATLAAMQGKPGSLNPNYTLDPAAAGQQERFVRVIFNAPAAMTGGDICRSTGGGSRQDELTHLTIGFCWNGQAISAIRGSAPRLSGPSDRYFAELVTMAARDLYPARDRH